MHIYKNILLIYYNNDTIQKTKFQKNKFECFESLKFYYFKMQC